MGTWGHWVPGTQGPRDHGDAGTPAGKDTGVSGHRALRTSRHGDVGTPESGDIETCDTGTPRAGDMGTWGHEDTWCQGTLEIRDTGIIGTSGHQETQTLGPEDIGIQGRRTQGLGTQGHQDLGPSDTRAQNTVCRGHGDMGTRGVGDMGTPEPSTRVPTAPAPPAEWWHRRDGVGRGCLVQGLSRRSHPIPYIPSHPSIWPRPTPAYHPPHHLSPHPIDPSP